MWRRRISAVGLAAVVALGMITTPERLRSQSGDVTDETQIGRELDVSRAHENADQPNNPNLSSAILVISLEEFYARSNFGLKAAAEFAESGGALATENRKIEAELIAEEKALADQRPSMEQVEFRALADAFDVKVQRIRVAQDAKVRAIGQNSETAKARFFEFAQPVLENIMRQRGAVLVIERESAILSITAIDVTVEAIAGINAVSQSTRGDATNE